KYLSILYDRLQRFHANAPNSDLTHSLRKRFDKALKSSLSRPMVCQTHFDLPSIFPEQILLAISQLVPKWNMTLSTPKCSVLHLGRLKTRSKYTLNGLAISPSDTVRDLGIHFSKNLNFGYHITQITRKTRSMCNLMLKSFHTNSPDILMKAYKIYIRPLLESSTVIWNPTAIGLVNRLENVQREFTRRVLKRSRQPPLSYLDRLKLLNIETLEYRRALRDMQFVYDSIHG
ncbi:hypothetical protein PFISCL1PPCAC_3866, partial [Pristionchus fissidentatus]